MAPLSYHIYKSLLGLFGSRLEGLLSSRSAKGKEDPNRLNERMGVASLPRPDEPLIWLNAASVGEVLSALALIERLLDERPNLRILVTTGTVTSAEVLVKRLEQGNLAIKKARTRVFHQFVPLDRQDWIDRFLDHWHPNLVLWMESELWPNMLNSLETRNIPAILVNARMSPRSFQRWKVAKGMAGFMLRKFRRIFTQSEAGAGRLKELGAKDPVFLGNLKFTTEPLPFDPVQLEILRQEIADRPCWVLASSHPGEEEVAFYIHRKLIKDHQDILTIIVPRHPHRADQIVRTANDSHLEVARRSKGECIQLWHDVYLVDTLGELGLFYRLAKTACIGGSLVDFGGHNPIEAAQLGCSILFGPYMENFNGLSQELKEAGAATQVETAEALAQHISNRLKKPELIEDDGKRALAYVAVHVEVLDRIMQELGPILDEAGITATPATAEAAEAANVVKATERLEDSDATKTSEDDETYTDNQDAIA